MTLKDNAEIQRRLGLAKNDLHQQVKEALERAGIHDIHIASIRLYLKRPVVQCPDGMEPVFEPETLPDGTVVYRWVCKSSA